MSPLKNLFKAKKDQSDLIDSQDGQTEENFFTDDTKYVSAGKFSSEASGNPQSEDNQEWLDENLEGQLSVDVYQDKDSIVIKSTIAGVRDEDIDISINNDLLTIKGKRENERSVRQEDYIYQECYWGNFSRSIILPVEVNAEAAQAELKNGILTIILPKAKPSKSISVKIKGE